MEKLIECPNLCDRGKVKIYPDPQKALYIHVDCPVCEGKYMVNEEKANKKLNSID